MPALRFGLIGLGNFGRHYARLLQHLPDASLAAVVARTANAFTAHKNLLPKEILQTTDINEVLKNPEIECVAIATPVSTHFDLASAALRAGKHVLLEKPMTTDIKEAEELCALAKASGKIFMVGYQYLYNDFVLELKKILSELGPIRFYFGEHLSPGPVRSDIGILFDAGVHDLSLISFLFEPDEIAQAEGEYFSLNSARDDFASAGFAFSSGLKAHILASRISPEKTRKITLLGENGTAQIDDRLESGKLRLNLSASGETEIPEVRAGEPLKNELEHFINCVRENKKPLTDADFGLKITKWASFINARLKKL